MSKKILKNLIYKFHINIEIDFVITLKQNQNNVNPPIGKRFFRSVKLKEKILINKSFL